MKKYLIDEKTNNVYDAKNSEHVGIYNKEKDIIEKPNYGEDEEEDF